jgi:DNA-binding Lrp family transcriptional regulator
MPLRAFILIEVAGDHTRSAYKTIQRMEGVRTAYIVTGGYDLIVHIEGQDLKQVNEVLQKIRGVQGVTKTTTCIEMTSHSPFSDLSASEAQ